MKLLYAFYPVLLLAGPFADILSGDIPGGLPFTILVFTAWAVDVVFTLTPR